MVRRFHDEGALPSERQVDTMCRALDMDSCGPRSSPGLHERRSRSPNDPSSSTRV